MATVVTTPSADERWSFHTDEASATRCQIASSGEAAVLYDADLPEGTMRFGEFFQVGEGRIQSIKLLYDAAQYRALGGR